MAAAFEEKTRVHSVRHQVWVRRMPGAWRRMIERLARRPAMAHGLMAALSFMLGVVMMVAAGIPAPAVHDEFSYLLAADTFAHGRLTNPPHPMWRHFDTFHELQHPTYMSKYYPGQGAILALGQVLMGDPFFGVLLSGALMCGALSYFFFAWLRPPWAVIAGLFTVATFGVNTYWTCTYWGGCLAAAGGALAFGAARYLFRRMKWRDPLLLALGVLLLTTTRMAECLVLLPILAVWVGWWFCRDRANSRGTKFRRVIVPLLIYAMAVLAIHGIYNRAVTGNALSFPYLVHFKQYEIVPATYFGSIGPEPAYVDPILRKLYVDSNLTYFPQPKTVANILQQEENKWFYFQGFYGVHLLMPGFAAVLLFLLPLLAVRRNWTAAAYATCACLVAFQLVVVYYLPHYSAPVLGLALVLLILALRRIGLWRWHGIRWGRALVRLYFAAIFTWFLLQFGGGVFSGQRPLDHIGSFSAISNVRPTVVANMKKRLPGRKYLVMVRYEPSHSAHYEWVFNAASPDEANVVWARSFGDEGDQDILAYYKDRAVFYFNGDTGVLTQAPDGRLP